MKNSTFKFKQFIINQKQSPMKIGIDSVMLGAWTQPESAENILDPGCGTGLLALMMAQKSNANIHAIEINEEAFREAQQNFKQSKWSNRIRISRISFQRFSTGNSQKFDLIICNPPFHQENILPEEAGRKLARHASSLTLQELLSGSKTLLKENGKLSFIYPVRSLSQIEHNCKEIGFFMHKICFVKANPEKNHHRVLLEVGLKQKNTESSELIIEENAHLNYTDEFKVLTRDFYPGF
jgi:tRNA1Val (adenine37-N6)-methyltransferase